MKPYRISRKGIKGMGQLHRLEQMYALYDQYGQVETSVCAGGCAACCTCNVTMTGLEARYLLAGMDRQEKKRLVDQLQRNVSKPRYLPEMTMNMFARMCMAQTKMPEEENDPSWGKCPVLEDNLCPLYPVRPFGCRAMMSMKNCVRNGYAQVPPEVLSLNHLFLQAIEHLDQGGVSGNFYDVLNWFLKEENTGAQPTAAHLLKNENIPVLMIPPEHRSRLAPVVSKLSFLMGSVSTQCP